MADATSNDIVKKGYLKVRRKDEKKLKKRYAVLRQESASLELYESDKKFRAGDKYKLAIALRPCFSVSTKVEPKSRLAIGLMGATSYTLAIETEDELTDWLHRLKHVHQGGRNPETEPPPTQYERMWDVSISDRGLGSTKKLNGQYCVGLTTDGIQFINKENPTETYDVPFMTIRGCRHVECFFWMEVGRTSCFGAGEINMQLEERIYAQNMHEVIRTKFSNSRATESDAAAGEPSRSRLPSTSEASRPISVEGRRNTISSNSSQQSTSTISLSTTPGRERTWSVPSRPRTTSEGTGDHRHHAGHGLRGRSRTSVHSRTSSMTAGSPPVLGSSFSPASVESNSSYGGDDHSHPIHAAASVIVEEAGDYLPVDPGRGYALDQTDAGGGGGGALRKRSMPPLSLPIPSSCDAHSRQPSTEGAAYLPMMISPGGGGAGARHTTPTGDAGYLPMFYSPAGSDTPDRDPPHITSPTASAGGRGWHSRDSSLTEEGYMTMFGGGGGSGSELAAQDASYMQMRPGTPALLGDEGSHSGSSSVAEPEADGYVSMAPGQLALPAAAPAAAAAAPADHSAASPYMDLHPGHRITKVSDDAYAEVSPASSCSLTSATPLTVLTPPSEDASPARLVTGATAAPTAKHSEQDSIRARASSLGSRLSQALMSRRRDRSESDSNSAECAPAAPAEHSATGLSSSLDSTVTTLKEAYRRRRKDSELREQTTPAAEWPRGSQDSLRHRPRSSSQSSQGSDKAHGGWRFLFTKRRDKKLGSVPLDVPTPAGRGSPGTGRAARSPGLDCGAPAPAPHHHGPQRAYADVQLTGGGGGGRSRSGRRRRQPAEYTEDDYLVMGPMHLDDEPGAGGGAGSLQRRPAPADAAYLPMEPAAGRRVSSPPLHSPPAPAPADYLNMQPGNARRRSAASPAPGATAGAAAAADYLQMERLSGGGGGSPGLLMPVSPSPGSVAGSVSPATSGDYLQMTPRSTTSLSPPSPSAPTVTSGAAGAATTGDYLEMSLGGGGGGAAVRGAETPPASASAQVQRSASERQPQRRPVSLAAPGAAAPLPSRPVSALLSVQTGEPAAADAHCRRKSDTAPLGDQRRPHGKVQRKHSGSGGGGAGAGLLRKLDAMNPKAMFRSLSQRSKKERGKHSPGAVDVGTAGAAEPVQPEPRPLVWSGSSQSLSSANSIQEEVDTPETAPPSTPVFGPADDARLGSASPCGSASSATPRPSVAGSQATTPRQTPVPTPSPAPLTPLTTSSSLTNFCAPTAAAAAAAGPAPVRQRHESNPPPTSLQRSARPPTGVGSQSLTTLPTEEQELVYASLDLADAETGTGQPPAAAHRLTYAKIDFEKCETLKQSQN